MSASDEPGLERAVLIATGIVQPVAEALGQLTGAAVLLDKAEAARAEARDFAPGLRGWYWVVPVELTGVHNGAACVLVSQNLVQARDDAAPDEEGAANFASMIDECLVRAGEKLGSAWGGPVSLDRLGLRRVPADSAPQVLSEALGPGGLVAVRFPARCPAPAEPDASGPARRPGGGQDEDAGEAIVVLGGRLAVEIAGWPAGTRARPGSAATQPVGGASAPGTAKALTSDIIRRARALTVRASADVGARSMKLGELARLGPGSVIDLGKKVTEPLELRVHSAARPGRLVASGDAVTLPRGFGFRVRYLGVR